MARSGALAAVAVGLSLIIGAEANAQQVKPESREQTRWSTSVRWGLEYDDNPQRQESYTGLGDGLTRYLVGADIVTDLDPSGQVSASIRHGGKLFHRESAASAALTQVGAQAGWQVHRRLRLQALADLKDRSERESTRDYNRGGASVRAATTLGPVTLYTGGGWRYFAFKPSPSSSNTGPRVVAGANWQVRNDLALQSSVGRTWRNYQSVAWEVEENRFVQNADGDLRRDDYDVFVAQLRYQRHFHGTLSYQYSFNRSNSFGQGMRRHGVVANVTVPLWWEVFLSAQGELQRTRYEDPVLIDEIFILDEDNRNHLTLALARPLGERWELELRYNVFLQEFGIDGQYRRQTLGLSVGYFLDGR